MSKCECKVVRKFALKTEKLVHSLCPIDRANKDDFTSSRMQERTCKEVNSHGTGESNWGHLGMNGHEEGLAQIQ